MDHMLSVAAASGSVEKENMMNETHLFQRLEDMLRHVKVIVVVGFITTDTNTSRRDIGALHKRGA